MAYRIFMLDEAGRVLTGSDVNCVDDEAARSWATTTLGSHAQSEIWNGGRCLGRISNAAALPTQQA